jgi:hypothetical protein
VPVPRLAKVFTLVAGMVAGADSISDMDPLRHGGIGRPFTGTRSPSTLGRGWATFSYAKQGAGYCYTGVNGSNALLATVLTRSSAPVIVAIPAAERIGVLRSWRRRLVADAVQTTRACGCERAADPARGQRLRGRDVIAAARRHQAKFSITARKDRAVTAAIPTIVESAWQPIRYPRAVFDEQLQQSQVETRGTGLSTLPTSAKLRHKINCVA